MNTLQVADWHRVEQDYRAGVLSAREIAAANGISHTAVQKRAKKHGWERDLLARIRAKAEGLVARQLLPPATMATDREVVEANATYIAIVRGEHRSDIKRLRESVKLMMIELEGASDPNLWARVRALAAPPLIDPTSEQERVQDARAKALIDALNRATAFPTRVAGLRALSDSLRTLIALEREALGLNDKSAGDKPQGRVLSDTERVARLTSILDRARRARDAAGGGAHASAECPLGSS